jgi:hypothetical protein
MTVIPRKADAKGRVTLGRGFAHQLVIVRETAEGVVEVIRAKAVPDPEIWLHKNPKAIRAVMQGIKQAKEGNLVDGPDLKAMQELADEMDK